MRTEKKSIVEEIKRKLNESTMFILADYSGLSASQMDELRSLLKQRSGDFMVVKNKLFRLALGSDAVKGFEEGLTGPTAVAFGSGDAAELTKAIVGFAGKNEVPKVKAGYIEGTVLSAAQIGVLASLPPREVLLARFVGGMRGSLAGFVGLMREMLRQFVSVVDQISKKRSEG